MLLLAALILFLAVGLPGLIRPSLGWSLPARFAWSAVVILPLGVLMGVPFPGGLRRFAGGGAAAVGVAWAVNGAASGIAGVLAAMSTLDLGLRTTMAIGAAAYLAAWLAFGRGTTPPG
jgi:hypothetical protein